MDRGSESRQRQACGGRELASRPSSMGRAHRNAKEGKDRTAGMVMRVERVRNRCACEVFQRVAR